jgi:TrmH family RNA methyltransferase
VNGGANVTRIASRDNALLVRVRKLSRDPAAYRKLHAVWLEGDHLCQAALAHGWRPLHALVSESAWSDETLRALALAAPRVARISDALFKGLGTLESPGQIGFVLAAQAPAALQAGIASVVLDRLQDAGNVGSILRSAAAFGVRQVVALKGTAALWSPKVLRAAMGAHFALHLVEGIGTADLHALGVPLVATSSHADLALPQAELPASCAWAFGHEGQGIEPALLQRCALTVRIPQPGGEESLNVASAAAVCLYEVVRRRAAR